MGLLWCNLTNNCFVALLTSIPFVACPHKQRAVSCTYHFMRSKCNVKQNILVLHRNHIWLFIVMTLFEGKIPCFSRLPKLITIIWWLDYIFEPVCTIWFYNSLGIIFSYKYGILFINICTFLHVYFVAHPVSKNYELSINE